MKNKLKLVLAVVLATIFVLSALSACSGDTVIKENSDGYLVFADTGGSDYQIVYPDGIAVVGEKLCIFALKDVYYNMQFPINLFRGLRNMPITQL